MYRAERWKSRARVGAQSAYADGRPYYSFGTTCYAWVHQGDELEEQTLRTLADKPFNKIRMCVFPKHYPFNRNEPVYYPYERDGEGNNDLTRFDPAFFAHFEKRLTQLQELGIEADIIIWHPYDRWGYAEMDEETDYRYLRRAEQDEIIKTTVNIPTNIHTELEDELCSKYELKSAIVVHPLPRASKAKVVQILGGVGKPSAEMYATRITERFTRFWQARALRR